MPWVIHLILGLSTWCIYLADRLYDVMRNQKTLETSRHDFTRNHLHALCGVLVIISICNGILIARYLPKPLLISGLVTLSCVGMYYLIRLSRLKHFISVIPREVMCGMLFAVGCAIAPHAYAGKPWTESPALMLTMLIYGMVCSASCILISVWETAADNAAADLSIVGTHERLLTYLPSALMILAVLSFALAWILPWHALIAIGMSAVLLRLTYHYRKRLSALHTRVLADAVLLTPLLFLGF
ncbi:MAG: hypothetical protein RL346_1052 [Verrucomicrobiota bacterium]